MDQYLHTISRKIPLERPSLETEKQKILDELPQKARQLSIGLDYALDFLSDIEVALALGTKRHDDIVYSQVQGSDVLSNKVLNMMNKVFYASKGKQARNIREAIHGTVGLEGLRNIVFGMIMGGDRGPNHLKGPAYWIHILGVAYCMEALNDQLRNDDCKSVMKTLAKATKTRSRVTSTILACSMTSGRSCWISYTTNSTTRSSRLRISSSRAMKRSQHMMPKTMCWDSIMSTSECVSLRSE